MVHNNSSISNSEAIQKSFDLTPGKFIHVLIWTLVWTVAIDCAINQLFEMPKSPTVMPSSMQRYFDYGRSIEGKLRRMIGDNDENTAFIANAGWIPQQATPYQKPEPGKIFIASYGQSFTNRILRDLTAVEPIYNFRLLGGPSAPLSHSYATYKQEADQIQADIIVIGVLASSLNLITATTSINTFYEAPAPYTFPRYILENGRLVEKDPVIHSLTELRSALTDKQYWQKYVESLKTLDPAYNSFVFNANFLDDSALIRLLRRSYAKSYINDVKNRYWKANTGFTNTDQLLDTASAIMLEFANDVKKHGKIPYIFLIQDQGYNDHLVKAFGKFLDDNAIPYFSTHQIAPADITKNFESDGHFTHEINTKLAKGLALELHKLLANKTSVD